MLQKWGFRQNGLFLTNLFIFLDKVKILKSKNSLDVQIRLQIKNSTVLAQVKILNRSNCNLLCLNCNIAVFQPKYNGSLMTIGVSNTSGSK